MHTNKTHFGGQLHCEFAAGRRFESPGCQGGALAGFAESTGKRPRLGVVSEANVHPPHETSQGLGECSQPKPWQPEAGVGKTLTDYRSRVRNPAVACQGYGQCRRPRLRSGGATKCRGRSQKSELAESPGLDAEALRTRGILDASRGYSVESVCALKRDGDLEASPQKAGPVVCARCLSSERRAVQASRACARSVNWTPTSLTSAACGGGAAVPRTRSTRAVTEFCTSAPEGTN